MVSEDNKVIHGLWIGPRLSNIEMLTLHSFTHFGHEFHLWVYDELENEMPEGVVLRDANEIIPWAQVFRKKENDPECGVGKGSYGAPFSDLFRYKLLHEHGGWWTDMDITCLQPIDFEASYFFRNHLKLHVIGNLMKCPKGSEFMRRVSEEASATCDENTLDWLKPNKILSKHAEEMGLLKYRNDNVTNIDLWPEIEKYIFGNKKPPTEWVAIHWMNEEWRSQGIDKNKIRYNTTLGKYMVEYGLAEPKTFWERVKGLFSMGGSSAEVTS